MIARRSSTLVGIMLAVAILLVDAALVLLIAGAGAKPGARSLWQHWMHGTQPRGWQPP
jgi:hypothetical protein